MSMRRQAYEWRNILPTGETVYKNGYPVLSINDCETVALSNGIPYDIFVGNVGNTLDVPGELKAFQYIVIDAIAVWPRNLYAQVYVNTTKYFQDPSGVPTDGISGNAVPFPNGHRGFLNFDYPTGLNPPIYVAPGQTWGIQVTPVGDIPSYNRSQLTDDTIAFCFVKYLLLDGADAIVAKRLINAGWELTVENIQRYKKDIVRNNILAGMAELPEEVAKAPRKV